MHTVKVSVHLGRPWIVNRDMESGSLGPSKSLLTKEALVARAT